MGSQYMVSVTRNGCQVLVAKGDEMSDVRHAARLRPHWLMSSFNSNNCKLNILGKVDNYVEIKKEHY